MKFNLIKKLDKKKTKTYFFVIFLLFVIFLIYYFPVKSNNNLFLEDNFLYATNLDFLIDIQPFSLEVCCPRFSCRSRPA